MLHQLAQCAIGLCLIMWVGRCWEVFRSNDVPNKHQDAHTYEQTHRFLATEDEAVVVCIVTALEIDQGHTQFHTLYIGRL